MINAYDRYYLERARISLARMLDYAVNDAGYKLTAFWNMFIVSDVSKEFEKGNVSVIAGKSGVELALMVLRIDKDYISPIYTEDKSKEYWTGWALAYYQWITCLSFSEITRYVSIEEIRSLYSPYHEMDIRQFCDKMNELIIERKHSSNLKIKRLAMGLTQTDLSQCTGIPLRTIQQYEQGQKDINKANSEYLIALSRALYCDPGLLLEKIRK